MELQYNTKTEVSRNCYGHLKNYFAGVIAFREDSGRFFIKLMLPSYSRVVALAMSRYL